MNDKSHRYLHPATGTFSSLDLSLCHPSLLLDFEWYVYDDQYGSDHFPIVIESINFSSEDHNPKWKLNKANWEQFHLLCDQFLNKENFKTALISSLILPHHSLTYPINVYRIPRRIQRKASYGIMTTVKELLDSENKHYQGSANILRKKI